MLVLLPLVLLRVTLHCYVDMTGFCRLLASLKSVLALVKWVCEGWLFASHLYLYAVCLYTMTVFMFLLRTGYLVFLVARSCKLRLYHVTWVVMTV
jgi:hypothetical protein